MIVVGLTGSIGMGKSTTAAMLRRLRIPVFDADAAVHRLLAAHGAAVAAVLEAFPGTGSEETGIDRIALGSRVFGDTTALRRLEAILHPRVRALERIFLGAAARRREPVVVLDIPLLFEGGGDKECDAVFVVSAPSYLQRQRVLGRRGMTARKFADILARQVPDREKRRATPYVVETGLGKAYSLNLLRQYLRTLMTRGKPGARHRLRYRNNRPRPG